jgi:hypothetical protein
LVCATALLVGCRQHAKPGEEDRSGLAEDHLVLTLAPAGDRLGPLAADTPFSEEALATLFPSASIRTSTRTSEGEPYPVAHIARGGTPLLDVHSGDGSTIYSVEILDGVTIEGLGVQRDASWAEVFPVGSVPYCNPGGEEESGQVVCQSPVSEHLLLLFGGDWNGPDGKLPPREVLVHWRLERLSWRPGGAPAK